VVETSSGIRVDFIFSFTPYEMNAINRAKKVIIQGQEVSFASPEDIIIHKLFAGRARDLEDVRTILNKTENINRKYIQHWLKAFDQSFTDKNLLETFKKLFSLPFSRDSRDY
jgi:predicted nucleotidyltransferase